MFEDTATDGQRMDTDSTKRLVFKTNRCLTLMVYTAVCLLFLCPGAVSSSSDSCLLSTYSNNMAQNWSLVPVQSLETEDSLSHILQHLVMASSTADIISRMLVSKVFIFYQKDYSYTALNALTQNLASMYVTFHLTEIDVNSVEDAFLEMNTLREENNTFVLLADTTQTNVMLTEVQRRNLIGPLYNWVLMAIDYQTSYLETAHLVNAGDRLVVVQLTDVDWQYFSTEDCSFATEALISRLDRFGLTRFSTIGYWNVENAWNLTSDVFPPFRGFYGKVFTITTIPIDYITIKRVINNNTYYFGVFFEVVNAMAEALNFRYQVVEPADQIFGALLPNGTVTGMIGMVHRREVDFAVGPFTISADRKELVDFMHPVHREELAMLMRKPKDDTLSSATVLIQPFSVEVWICFCFSVVFAALALWVIARVDPAKDGDLKRSLRISQKDFWILRKSFWYSLGTALNQGGIVPNTTFATFTIVISVWLMNIILLATYTGNLIAFLSVSKISLPINTLADLVNQNEYKVGVLGHSAHQSIFEAATEGFYKKVWNKIDDDPGNLVAGVLQGYAKAKTEKFIFINEKTMFDILTAVDCDVVMAKETFLPRGLGFPIQQGSPYTRIFDIVTLRIMEGGLVDKWRETYISRNSKCSLASTQAQAKSLGLVGMQGAFILLILGMSMGCLALIVEIIVYKKLYAKVWPSKNNITQVQEFSVQHK